MSDTKQHFNIVLIEDDPVDVELIRGAFSRYGDVVRLHHFASGLAAIELLDRFSTGDLPVAPHLLIIDVDLPDTDGSKIYTKSAFTKASHHIPMIIFTGGGHDGLKACAAQDERTIYLQKPDSRKGYMEAADTMLRHAAAFLTPEAA